MTARRHEDHAERGIDERRTSCSRSARSCSRRGVHEVVLGTDEPEDARGPTRCRSSAGADRQRAERQRPLRPTRRGTPYGRTSSGAANDATTKNRAGALTNMATAPASPATTNDRVGTAVVVDDQGQHGEQDRDDHQRIRLETRGGLRSRRARTSTPRRRSRSRSPLTRRVAGAEARCAMPPADPDQNGQQARAPTTGRSPIARQMAAVVSSITGGSISDRIARRLTIGGRGGCAPSAMSYFHARSTEMYCRVGMNVEHGLADVHEPHERTRAERRVRPRSTRSGSAQREEPARRPKMVPAVSPPGWPPRKGEAAPLHAPARHEWSSPTVRNQMTTTRSSRHARRRGHRHGGRSVVVFLP